MYDPSTGISEGMPLADVIALVDYQHRTKAISDETFDKYELLRLTGRCRDKRNLDPRICAAYESSITGRSALIVKEYYTSNGKFLPDIFTNEFVKKYNVIKLNGRICAYYDHRYQGGADALSGIMLMEEPRLLMNQRNEVYSQIRAVNALDGRNMGESDPKYIQFCNGVLNIETQALEPLSSDIRISNIIPWNYNATAYSETVDKMMDDITCNDKNLRNLIEEMIGYCLYRSLKFRKFFVLVGGKRNGKSTFLELLIYALGVQNVSSLGLQDYQVQFSRVRLFGMLANIGDDISDEYIKETDMIKKLISGEPVQAAEKGREVFFFKNYATSIFSANNVPRVRDPTGAYTDRIIPIPFNATFSEDTADVNILDKILTRSGAEYILRLGVDGLKRLLRNKRFTTTDAIENDRTDMNRDNNHLIEFLERTEVVGMSRDDVILAYDRYCTEERIPLQYRHRPKTLTRRINQELGTELHKFSNTYSVFEKVKATEGSDDALLEKYRINSLGLSEFDEISRETYTVSEIERLMELGYIYNEGKAYHVAVKL